MLIRSLRAVGEGLLRLPRPAAWTLVVAWFALISWLSSQPGRIEVRPWYLSVLSNLAHAPLFGLLGMWLVLLVERRDGWPALSSARVVLVLAAVAAFGVADELHQHVTPNRNLSVCDLVTDISGAGAVLVVVQYLGREARTSVGVCARLALGLLACIAAAFAATHVPAAFPEHGWL